MNVIILFMHAYINIHFCCRYTDGVLKQHGLEKPSAQIWNCDESGIAGKGNYREKVYGVKGIPSLLEDVSFVF